MKKLFTIILIVVSFAMGQSFSSAVNAHLSPIADVNANWYQGTSISHNIINIHLSFVDVKDGSFLATFSVIDSSMYSLRMTYRQNHSFVRVPFARRVINSGCYPSNPALRKIRTAAQQN